MLAIRLTRTGKKHEPHYRIVVQEKRSKLDGKAIDYIGHYHPAQAGKLLVIDKEKAKEWLAKGAQCSDTVTNLFVKEGILDASKKVHNFFTPVKKEKETTEEIAVKEEVAEVKEDTDETATIAEEAPVATEEVAAEEFATEEVAAEEDTEATEKKA